MAPLDADIKDVNLIGFHGFARAGKDTGAEYLERFIHEQLGEASVRRGFADEVKIAIGAMFGLPTPENAIRWCDILKISGSVTPRLRELDSYETSVFDMPVDGRQFIINFAEHMRKDDENFWIHRLLDKDWHPNAWGLVTDVRFEPGIRAIQARGGKVLGIWNPRVRAAHPTEKFRNDLVDWIVPNEGDLPTFCDSLEWAFRRLYLDK